MDIKKNKNITQSIQDKMLKTRKKNLKRFQDFTNVPNRMERVRVHNQVVFINDSKAENTNATYFALQSIRKPIVWLVGGDDRHTDYWDLMSLVRRKVDTIIMIGKHNDKINFTFSPVLNEIFEAETMEKAVKLAYRLSEPGTTVLLSPAAKADELYADYEDRGQQFINAVKKI